MGTDADNDGVSDSSDNCTLDANSSQLDSNTDDLGDASASAVNPSQLAIVAANGAGFFSLPMLFGLLMLKLLTNALRFFES